MDKDVDISTSQALIGSIIDGLFHESLDVFVIVTPVIWANSPRMQANMDGFNQQLEAIILQKKQQRKHILAARVSIGPGDRQVSPVESDRDGGFLAHMPVRNLRFDGIKE